MHHVLYHVLKNGSMCGSMHGSLVKDSNHLVKKWQ